ncbi:MAG: hypothetical protein JWM05_2946 [Acidimicrobiales bacterium]|nr:hypothetical protein [Acidimicrobiales bacterium]
MTVTEPPAFAYDPERHPRRLNLGCGFDHREGHLNVDFQEFHEPDLVADVRDLSMLPSGAFDEILAQDVLEHLPRSDTATALAEWARLLRPGGLLHLQMPDVTACGRFLVDHDDTAEHEQLISQLFGTQGYTGDFHLAGFTDLTLVEVLRRAGFHRTELGTRDGWMLTSTSQRCADGEVPDPLAVGWLAGFWPGERAEGGSWRWCDRAADLLLVNQGDLAITVRLAAAFGRSPGGDGIVRVEGPRGSFLDEVPVPAVGEAPWERRLVLEPGVHRLRFSSPTEPLDVPDARTLVFRLTDPSVTLA